MGSDRPPDRIGDHEDVSSGAGWPRRRFLVYSAAAAAGSFLISKLPARVAGEPRRLVPSASDGTGFVVQPTPSRYFVHRENGSEEMKWGPVGQAALRSPVRGFGDTIPNDRFYIHNRACPPVIDRLAWRLRVTGDAILRARSFSFAELLMLPQVTVRRTLDCGANCAAFFPKLPPSGADDRWLPVGYTQWHFGAVGAAEWTGARVGDVLAAAGVDHPAEVKFTGLDEISTPEGTVPYSEVLTADKVLQDDTLLVHRMNGEDLPVDHGYPIRLLVSGWGGNTHVKWVGEIEASKEPIPVAGPQANQVLTGPAYPTPVRPTVGRLRSAIEHNPEITLVPGDLTLRGRAWSGAGAITHVHVAVEQLVKPGQWRPVMPWREARLLSPPEPLMWVRFEVSWPGATPGQYRVMSRATDEAGDVQPAPEDVVWNQHGLGYNGHAPLDVIVLPSSDMP
jgi:DMSO/TMAO reductase YedYZ molybdopterin-dependent catalytic subunit